MMLMHFDILANWDLMTHISTLYCMQPTQTDRFQLPTYNFYVQVMKPHKVVSLISLYKDIEEQETGSTWIYVDLRHLSELCPSSVRALSLCQIHLRHCFMSCGISPRCAMSRIRVIGTAQVNSSEKDGSDGKIRRAMKSSASPLDDGRSTMGLVCV